MFSNGLVILEEKNEVDWQISDLSFVCDFSSIRKYKGFLDAIGFVRNEVVQCAMDGVVSARFDLDWYDRETVIVINEVVDFTLLAVVVIKELVSMGMKFTCDDAFVDSAKIDAAFIVEDGADVIAKKDTRKDSDVVEIELQEVFAAGSDQGKGWC